MRIPDLHLRTSTITAEVRSHEGHNAISDRQELVVADLSLLGARQHQIEEAAEAVLAPIAAIARDVRVEDLAVVVVIREHAIYPVLVEGGEEPPGDLEIAVRLHP
jgi:hypothetical protein